MSNRKILCWLLLVICGYLHRFSTTFLPRVVETIYKLMPKFALLHFFT
jgi:hypothetical protein